MKEQTKSKINLRIVSFFEKLLNEGKSGTLEFERYSTEGPINATISLLECDDLNTTLKDVRVLGIHRLDKKISIIGAAQFANGQNEKGDIKIRVYPTNKAFNGCKSVEYETEITVPAQEAKEAVPAHVEKVKHAKIVCDEQAADA